MKKVFIILISLLFTNISFAELKPIPPYAGDDPWMPQLSRWGEIQAIAPEVKSSQDKAKLANYKERFNNWIEYLNKIDSNTAINKASKYSEMKYYDKIMEKAANVYLEIGKNKIYDKESIELLDKVIRKCYTFYVLLYQEQGGEFIKKNKLA